MPSGIKVLVVEDVNKGRIQTAIYNRYPQARVRWHKTDTCLRLDVENVSENNRSEIEKIVSDAIGGEAVAEQKPKRAADAANLLVEALLGESNEKVDEAKRIIEQQIGQLKKDMNESIARISSQAQELEKRVAAEQKKIAQEGESQRKKMGEVKEDMMRDAAKKSQQALSNVHEVEKRIESTVSDFRQKDLVGLKQKVDRILAVLDSVGQDMSALKEDLAKGGAK